MENLINQINATLTGYVLLVLLVGTGLWFTVRTRFVQVRCLAEGFRNMFCRKADGADQHGLTSFQAVSTAIAAQVGTGNIVGAASAILVGGPGAIFWMWVIAFFGMATSYAETVLAMRTRSRHKDGKILGGPVFYIKRAFRGRLGRYLAVFFACALVIALGFAGVMVQANAIAGSLESATGVPPMVVGVVLVALCALVFLGGVRRVGRVSARVVPIMAFLFLGGAFVVLALRAQYIPATFGIIVHDAFAPQSIIGGTFGTA
ncbi:MAG: sodium:alanine symporter family protein, partial [Bacteroidaceae bacterium]|nr:sodium:alanine symporter family protein [Bacteroidaceae bacterium]